MLKFLYEYDGIHVIPHMSALFVTAADIVGFHPGEFDVFSAAEISDHTNCPPLESSTHRQSSYSVIYFVPPFLDTGV